MIIRTIEIDTEEHAQQLDEILSKLPYVNYSRTISVKNAALGLVNEPMEDELISFFTEDKEDEILIAADEVFKKYKH
jgi:hypothetical protein